MNVFLRHDYALYSAKYGVLGIGVHASIWATTFASTYVAVLGAVPWTTHMDLAADSLSILRCRYWLIYFGVDVNSYLVQLPFSTVGAAVEIR